MCKIPPKNSQLTYMYWKERERRRAAVDNDTSERRKHTLASLILLEQVGALLHVQIAVIECVSNVECWLHVYRLSALGISQ